MSLRSKTGKARPRNSYEEEEFLASKQGLLQARRGSPTRISLDEAEQFVGADENFDDLHTLDNIRSAKAAERRGHDPLRSPSMARAYARRERFRVDAQRQRKTFCSKSCCIVVGILGMGLLGLIIGSGFFVYRTAPPDGLSDPWYPTPKGGTVESWSEAYKKAQELISKMSLLEKVNITTGVGWSQDLCVGNTAPATEVGFPGLCLQDGPLGLRFNDHSTAFPAAITVGATWNKTLMYLRGQAHGMEARLKGVNVLLGPAMGPLGKMPAGGRNWEGFGSDPVLQAVAASQTIKGIQDEHVMATAKHYILNEQEHFRQTFEWGLPNAMSSNADDRTLHELYLWPFAESVRAGVASIMCSYNMVNSSYACGNSKLLNGILKDELGFQGFVQSDWLAQRSGVASALAGLDMSMPGDGLIWANGDSLWGQQMTLAALNGSLPLDRIDDMVTRIIAAYYKVGQDDKTMFNQRGPNFSSWTKEKMGHIHEGSDDDTTAVVNEFVNAQGNGSHAALARRVAAEGTVLVKNLENILPLNPQGGVSKAANSKFRVGVFGEDAGPGEGPNACADRGCNQGTLASGWGSGAVEFPYLVTPISALRETFNSKTVQVDDFLTNSPPFKQKPEILQAQDLCIVFANADAGEGFIAWDGVRGDRNDLYLQKAGDDLIEAVASGCGDGQGSTVVVVHSVGPVVLERWIDLPGVKAVVLANLPGQESGNALADVLFGRVDASGRLPYTIGKQLEDYGPGGQVLYYPNGVTVQQNFDDGLYIDYRYFDKRDIEPRFEFGFGLSYTTFEMTDLSIETVKPKSALPEPRLAGLSAPSYDSKLPDSASTVFPINFRKLRGRIYPYINSVSDIGAGRYPYPAGYDKKQTPSAAGGGEGGNPSLFENHANVTVKVTNTGSRKGQEVVQLYVSFPDSAVEKSTGAPISFPVKVLRGFEKVELDSGDSTEVTISLTRKDLSYWSVVQQNWVMPTGGNFTIRVGRSSRDLPLQRTW